MDTTRSSSLTRRARLLRRGGPLVATAAALALTTACTDGTQQHGSPAQRPADHSVTVDGGTSVGSGSITVEHGPDGSSVTVDHGPDGSVSVNGGSVHVNGGAGSVSVQRNPDGSVTITRPGAPPTTVPAGSSDASSGSVSVTVDGGGSSVSVQR